jgi:hypothetical protein
MKQRGLAAASLLSWRPQEVSTLFGLFYKKLNACQQIVGNGRKIADLLHFYCPVQRVRLAVPDLAAETLAGAAATITWQIVQYPPRPAVR